ncbi:ankyrin repeat domain-containing protein [Thermodesulfobacteriota bacterium]
MSAPFSRLSRNILLCSVFSMVIGVVGVAADEIDRSFTSAGTTSLDHAEIDGKSPLVRERSRTEMAAGRPERDSPSPDWSSGTGSDKPKAKKKTRIQKIKEKARGGDADAQYKLGQKYQKGRGVKKDAEKAVKWYGKAARQGHAKAQYELGLKYYKGTGVEKDKTKALKWFRKAGKQGHAKAQYSVAYIYFNGKGVKEDETEALKWFRKAGKRGHAESQYQVAQKYFSDKGFRKASKWYRKAAKQGHANAQYMLAKSNSELEENYEESLEMLGRATRKGHGRAKKLLRNLAEIDDRAKRVLSEVEGDDPKREAPKKSRKAKKKISQEKKNRFLCKAIAKGNVDFAEQLLEDGASPNSRHEGLTALHIAAIKGRPKMIKLLLDKGAKVNGKTDRDGSTVLMTAAQFEQATAVKLLLDHGAKVNARDDKRQTALMRVTISVEKGTPKIAKLLLDHGANANARDKKGWTPLHFLLGAEKLNDKHLRVAELLLSHGANIHAKMDNGLTPWAVLRHKYNTDNTPMAKKMLKLFKAHGGTRQETEGRRESNLAEHILFKSGSAKLLASSMPNLRDIGRTIKKVLRSEGGYFFIDVHVYGKDSAKEKCRLSIKRAKSIKRYMVNAGGIPSQKLKARGFGSRYPKYRSGKSKQAIFMQGVSRGAKPDRKKKCSVK